MTFANDGIFTPIFTSLDTDTVDDHNAGTSSTEVADKLSATGATSFPEMVYSVCTHHV